MNRPLPRAPKGAPVEGISLRKFGPKIVYPAVPSGDPPRNGNSPAFVVAPPICDAPTTEAASGCGLPSAQASGSANGEATKSATSTPSDLLTTPVRPEPGPRETAAIADAKMRVRARKNRLAVAAQQIGEALILGPRHSDIDGYSARMMDAFGTNSISFIDQALGRLAAIMRRKGAVHPTEAELNAALAAIDGIQPGDEIQAALAEQMIATHETAMEMLTRAKQADLMPTLQECGSLAVKLFRTYTAQVEALVRLRRGGEQRVIVQHVNVNEGGQAIVGAVNHPGGSEK